MELIQLNKFSHLHDGKKIFFCKTDFLIEEFENIKKIDDEVILITGNSDFPISDNVVNFMPNNIKKWYGQNVLTFNDKIVPIPMGIENRYESIRYGHGIGYYDRVETKENLLNRKLTAVPTKKIYSNFQIDTNYFHRKSVREICMQSSHIDWNEPNLSLDDFFNKILDYKMVVCPAGNGVDTHRIWEVLYSNRIPITIKIGNYKIYDLYSELPIVVLDKIEDLSDFEIIENKHQKAKKNYNNIELINFDFWKKEIINIL